MKRVIAAMLIVAGVFGDFSILTSHFSIPAAEAATGINRVINYQGKVSSNAGSAVTNGTYNMRFKLFDAPTGGNILWSEPWTNATTRVTMTGGLFSVGLGTHVTMTGSVNFNSDNLYLQVEFDPGNDGTFEETFAPRRRFGSVVYAHNADTIDGVDSSEFLRKNQANTMTGSLTINNSNGNAVTVRGAISGAIIHASSNLSTSGSLTVKGNVQFKSFTGCVLIATDAQGNLSCSTTPAVSTGTIVAIGNSRYVNTSGDTMTGALTINVTNGTIGTVGLNVKNTISGAVIRAQKTLASSGGLVWEGTASGASLYVASSIQGAGLADCDLGATSKLLWDSSNGRFFCGSDQTGNAAVYLQDSFTDSNGTSLSLHTMDTGPGWTIVSGSFEIQNAGARDTFDGGSPIAVSNAGSSDGVASVTVLPWTGNNSAGLIGRYVDSNNYWMVSTNTPANNAVLYEVTGGSLTNRADISYSFDSGTPYTLKLVFDGTSIEVYIDNTLQATYTSSAHQSATRFGLRSFHDTNVGYTATNYDNFSVTSIGDDTSSIFGTGNVLTIGDSRYLRRSGGTMTGALTINVTGGNNATLGLNVLNTISGAVIRAQKSLFSSGGLVWEGSASGASLYVATSLNGAGLVDCDIAGTSKLLWDASTGRFSCGTDTDTNTQFSNTGALRTAFDARYVNTAGDTMTGALTINVTGGNNSTIGLNVLNTISGAVIRAQKTLTSSGELTVEGVLSTDSQLGLLNIAGSLDVSNGALEVEYGTRDVNVERNIFIGSGINVGSNIFADQYNLVGLGDYANLGEAGFSLDRTTGIIQFFGANVGVNTPIGTVQTQFEVNGTMSGAALVISRGSFFSGSGIVFSDSGAVVFNENSRNVDFRIEGDTNQNAFYVDASNNSIGIGTDAPQSALHVYNATAVLRLQDSAADDALTADPAVAFYTASGTRMGFVGDASPSGDLMNVLSDHGEVRITTLDNKPVTFRTNNAVRMTISGAGLIGIGTTRPKAMLDVAGSISGTLLTLSNMRSCTLKTSATGTVICGTDLAGVGGNYVLKSGDTMTGAMNIVIDTLSGDDALYIAANALGNSDSLLRVRNEGSEVDVFKVSGDGIEVRGSGSFIIDQLTRKAFEFYNNYNGTVIMSMDSLNDRVGIGTSAPKAKLDVTGTISGALITQHGAGNNFFGGTVLIGTGSHANTTSNYALTVNAQSAPGLIERIAQFGATDTHGYFEFANGTSGNGGFSPVITGKATSNFPGFFLLGNTERDIAATQSVLIFRGRVESGSLVNQVSLGNLLQIQNVNTGVFTIKGSGATRIGTGQPNSNTQLDVLGTISGSLITQNGTGSNYFRGNVGIGTTTPNRGKLHIHDATESSIHITSQLSGSANTDGLFFGLNNNGTDSTFWNFESGYLRFATNNSEQVRILSTGEVGIGTTAPKAKLDVAGTISGSSLLTLSSYRNCTLKTSSTGMVLCGSDLTGGGAGSNSGTTHLAKMSRVAAQSIPHNTNTNIDFDSEFYDVGDIANISTNRFTISRTGKYLITAYAVTAGAMDAGEGFILYMNKNGTTVNYDVNYSIATDQAIVATVTDTLSLVAGDYIEMAAYQNEGAAVNTSVAHMSVVQVDGTVTNVAFSTGNVLAIGDSRYIRRSGGTMTGALTLNVTGGNFNTVGLEVIQTLSGSHLHANNLITSSGSIVVEGGISNASGAYTLTSAKSVTAIGRYAYVATSNDGVAIVDTVNPYSLSLVGSYNTSGSSNDLAVVGEYMYVADGSAGLQIIDISNPSSPSLVSTLDTTGGGDGITVAGRYAYIADGSAGLQIIDISNPAAPFLVGTYNTAGSANKVAIAGKYAYVADGSAGLQIIDISNPAAPTLKGTYNTSGTSYDVAVSGKYAYVADGTAGMLIFNISNPASPSVTGTYSLPGGNTARSVKLSGDTAYLAVDIAIETVDIRIPSAPKQINRTTTATIDVVSIDVSGNYAYAITTFGLQVYPINTLNVPSAAIGTIESDNIIVRELARINGNMIVDRSVNIGAGLQVLGQSSIFTNSGSALTLGTRDRTGKPALNVIGTISGALITQNGTGVNILQGRVAIGTGTNLTAQQTIYTDNNLNNPALFIRSRETTASVNMIRLVTDVTSINNTVFRVTASGGVYSDTRFSSTGADYAEWFFSTDDLQPGETVCIDVTRNNAVKRCSRDGDGNIMGIVSTNPAFVGNHIIGAEDGIMPPGYHLIGLIGQVPTLVNDEGGEIRPGDSLTASSIAGVARRAGSGESTVGVALEAMDEVSGRINVLISRRNQSLTVEAVEENVLATIAAMEIEDEVEVMISSALGDLNVDQQISDEVTRQLEGMTTHQQTIDAIQSELASLKAELDGLKVDRQQSVVDSGSILNGHLAASSLELDDTLVTGSDARVGGDLTVDGSITASSLFVPNGLNIQGGIVMQGLLDTTELRVAQNAIIDGTMTINGSLTLGSGAYLNFGSGALSIGDLIVHNSLYVMGEVTIDGLATFMNNVEIKGELIVSDKHAGYAMIPAGGTGVTVHFGSGYTQTPVVTASPDVPVLYGVSKSSATGFTIRLAAPAAEDIIFAWHALSVGNPITTFVLKNEDDMLIFPLDTNNVPVSSSAEWNACIRNIPMMDDSGQPQSCARYHDAYTWTHPDLNISFIWNTSLNPAFLKVPDGYVPTVTENAQNVEDGIDPELEEVIEEEVVVPATDTGSTIVEPETNTGTTVIEEASSSSAAASSEATSSVPAEEVIEEEPVVEGPVEEAVVEPTVEETPVEEPQAPAAE